MRDESWTWDAPLERYKGETSRANVALQDYVLMGPGRSLRALHRGYSGLISPEQPGYALFSTYCPQSGAGVASIPPTRRQRTLHAWSARYQWQARVARHQQIENDRRLTVRDARRQELEDCDWSSGQELRVRVHKFLELLPDFQETVVDVEELPDGTQVKTIVRQLNTSLSQISQALRAASELQRLSVAEPTDIAELRGAPLLAELVAELDRLCEAGTAADPTLASDSGVTGLIIGDPHSASENTGSEARLGS